MRTKSFTPPTWIYDFRKGPLPLHALQKKIHKGNCRLAVQYYFFKQHNVFLAPRKVLNPYAYLHTGHFIIKEGKISSLQLKKLKGGDIIYAERKNKKILPKNRRQWIIALHVAVYLEKKKIWHATTIEGKSCVWSFKKFCQHYRVIAIKRILT